MPKERFYGLPSEKRESILCAAREEFAKFHFEAVSVSRIVKGAGISQGSFYTYFENKEDLWRYLFEELWSEAKVWFYETLKKCDGNICDAALYAVARMVKIDKEQPEFGYYRNILMDVGRIGTVDLLHGDFSVGTEQSFRGFVNTCYEKTNLDCVREIDREGFACLLEILVMIVLKSAVIFASGNCDNVKILMVAERQIRLLRA